MTHNRDLAHCYAAAGHRVLPIGPTSKRPMVAGGFHAATVDAAQIAAWWRQGPSALPGLACERFWVLDLDHPSDGTRDGLKRVLEPIGLDWIVGHAGLIVHTPRGGKHIYFASTAGIAIGTRAGDIADKIDTRGHTVGGRPTGYIIAPGSQRPDGTGYRVVEGSLEAVEPAPRRLLALGVFNRRERADIAAAPTLRDAINAASADQWRAIYECHTRAVKIERLRLAPKLTDDTAEPMRRQALADLADHTQRLAATIDGRKVVIFKAACALGRYVSNGVLSEPETTAALLDAWIDCGAAQKHGMRYGAAQIADGLRKSASDPLPPLARRFRDPVLATTSFRVVRPLKHPHEDAQHEMDPATT